MSLPGALVHLPSVRSAAFLLVLASCGTPEAPVTPAESFPFETGNYRAWLDSPGGDLAFGLELKEQDGGWEGWLINGAERLSLDEVRVEGDEIILDIAHYDADLTAKATAEGLEGAWRKTKPGGVVERLPFHAERDESPLPMSAARSIRGRYLVDFSSDEEPAVAIFSQEGAVVTGTFLTTLGDYRYLAGRLEGDDLTLSTFDGAHAFLFKAQRTPQGSLKGDFWSGSSWHETWTAVPRSEPKLPDPLGLTTADESVDWASWRYPDLSGTERGLDEWNGKPRLVQIMGSWCPNCNDQTELLVELTRIHPELEVVSLAFEHGELKRNTAVVSRYKAFHEASWDYLLAGPTDKTEASGKVGFIDQVRSYPTLLFVGADDKVKAVYTGFTGPAAPEEHKALRGLYERLIAQIAE